MLLNKILYRLKSKDQRLYDYNINRIPNTAYEYEDLLAEGYFSQCGQDKLIVEGILPNLRNGTFVDIGAHDGRKFSNTLYLERHLHWSGIAVEPIPEIHAQLRKNRTCATVNACVGAKSGTVKFRHLTGYCEMLSGIVDQYDPRHQQRIQLSLNSHGGTSEEIEVQCVTLNDLLSSHNIDHVDYMNIDVEGGELAILNGFDFNRFDVSVFGVENPYANYHIHALFNRHNYRLHSIAGDEFYIKQSVPSMENNGSNIHRTAPEQSITDYQ